MTNEIFHTIAAPLLAVAIEEPILANVKIIAYPNPFIESTTIEVGGIDFKELSLSLFDINGRLMSSLSTEIYQFN
ncbi:MAG: hypothetical protein ACI8P3_001266 [Saprospiraceae bacterium]